MVLGRSRGLALERRYDMSLVETNDDKKGYLRLLFTGDSHRRLRTMQ
jgi:hypothetical protein